MAKSKGRKFDYSQKIIQQKANNLLESVILGFNDAYPEIYWNPHDAEDQNDIGMDFEYELIDKSSQKIIFIFKIQNKGSATKLKPLINTANKGSLSFQLPLKKALSYYKEINVPLIITVCDIQSSIVYWHAIQLDNSIEEYIDIAIKKGKNSIQIYIDPQNQLIDTNLEKFFKEIKNSQDEQYHRAKENRTHSLFSETDAIKIDSTKHLLDQVYDAIMQYLDEFSIIPPGYLIQLSPIKKSKGQLHFYHCFKAVVDNVDFFNLIQQINSDEEIKDSSILSVQDYPNKISVILNALKVNRIDYLENRISQNVITIKSIPEGETCNCCRCEFNRYKLLTSVAKSILEKADSLDDKMKKAYNNYKTGNYIASYKQLLKIRDQAKKEEKYVQFFLCQYNLVKLRSFMLYYNFGNQEALKATADLKDLNILDEYYKVKSKSFFGKELLSWITEEKFFHEFTMEINDIVKNIENHYESQLKGGWSNNSYACQLINELAKIESFLTYNHIIFDNLPEFRRFFKIVVKGLFCSHAIKESEKSRIKFFNDFVVHIIFVYGDAQTLLEYFSKFHLNEIKYQSDKTNPTLFTDLLLNNLKNYSELNQGLIDLEEGNVFMPKFVSDSFNNSLVLAAILNIGPDEINLIGDSIASELAKTDFILPGNVPYLIYFINRKGKFFEIPLILKFVHLSFSNSSLHAEDYIETVCNMIHTYFPTIVLEEDSYDNMLRIYGSKCPICNYQHSNQCLIHYYLISSSATKMKLKAYIELILKKTFDPGLYYACAISDIVQDVNYLDSYYDYAKPSPEKRSLINIFKKDDSNISVPLIRFIELCYKFRIDLNVLKYKEIRNYGPYYDWLLNLEEYDYSNFNPEWLLIYPSSRYLKHMSTIDQIKQKMRHFLKSNFNPNLQKIYMQYFAE